MCRNPITSKHGEKQMEEETGNECLINPEPQATEQPTNPQPTTQPNPEQNQEATKTPKQEEKKMSEADLNKFSVEELQAALEAKKAEEANKELYKDLGIDFNNPKQGDLVKWIYSHENLTLGRLVNRDIDQRIAADFPGDIKPFVTLLDDYNGNIVAEEEKVHCIRIWDVDIEHKQVLDCRVLDGGDFNTFRRLMGRLFHNEILI